MAFEIPKVGTLLQLIARGQQARDRAIDAEKSTAVDRLQTGLDRAAAALAAQQSTAAAQGSAMAVAPSRDDAETQAGVADGRLAANQRVWVAVDESQPSSPIWQLYENVNPGAAHGARMELVGDASPASEAARTTPALPRLTDAARASADAYILMVRGGEATQVSLEDIQESLVVYGLQGFGATTAENIAACWVNIGRIHATLALVASGVSRVRRVLIPRNHASADGAWPFMGRLELPSNVTLAWAPSTWLKVPDGCYGNVSDASDPRHRADRTMLTWEPDSTGGVYVDPRLDGNARGNYMTLPTGTAASGAWLVTAGQGRTDDGPLKCNCHGIYWGDLGGVLPPRDVTVRGGYIRDVLRGGLVGGKALGTVEGLVIDGCATDGAIYDANKRADPDNRSITYRGIAVHGWSATYVFSMGSGVLDGFTVEALADPPYWDYWQQVSGSSKRHAHGSCIGQRPGITGSQVLNGIVRCDLTLFSLGVIGLGTRGARITGIELEHRGSGTTSAACRLVQASPGRATGSVVAFTAINVPAATTIFRGLYASYDTTIHARVGFHPDASQAHGLGEVADLRSETVGLRLDVGALRAGASGARFRRALNIDTPAGHLVDDVTIRGEIASEPQTLGHLQIKAGNPGTVGRITFEDAVLTLPAGGAMTSDGLRARYSRCTLRTINEQSCQKYALVGVQGQVTYSVPSGFSGGAPTDAHVTPIDENAFNMAGSGYTVARTAAGLEITFGQAPAAGAVGLFRVVQERAATVRATEASGQIVATGNGSATTFTAALSVAGSPVPTVTARSAAAASPHYVTVTNTLLTVTYLVAPANGVPVTLDWRVATSP